MTEAQDRVALDRVAQLQARRAGAATAAPKRRAATGSKIAAAGVGMTTMFGLVGAMALAQDRGSSTPQPAQPTAPAQVVVVIHRDGGTGTVAGTGVNTVAASSTPIQLSAQPVVRQAPASSPAASTRGSR